MKKILIANRGEIAVRIIRVLRELGIKSVAVFSKADRTSLHTGLADEAYFIGDSDARKSYLNIEKIIQIASQAKVDAVHPGYGFLAEDSHFIKILEDIGIKFIGPVSEAVNFLGNKINAREKAKNLGIPVLPGSDNTNLVKDANEAREIAKAIGYPVMLKAASGGGGRGIRIVEDPKNLEENYMQAQKEAKSSCGDDSLYIETYLKNVRHIEIQVLADNYGNVEHLWERECSLQRKRQKIVEEAPSLISNDLREKLTHDAVRLIKSVNYTNIGTVEFLVTEEEKYYFMEVNTRIQVEHPITEMVTGVDIVKEQIQLSCGEKLSVNNVKCNGHAIEARICAEDPFSNFTPCQGKIEKLHFPGGFGVRVDTYIQKGQIITPYYDSMIAKLICHGKTRKEAISKILTSLMETKIFGVKTTIPFLSSLLRDKNYEEGNIHTTFVDEIYKKMVPQTQFFKENEEILVAILAAVHQKQKFTRKLDKEKLKEQSSRWVMEGRMMDMRGS
jgi:acetyl-CoA carboxylase biotin carboxylase subunit